MKKIRYGLIVLSILVCSATSATAQVSIGIGLPNISIGINLPLFPELVPVPGYPVYYAPRMDANYFFYDGLYWVYMDDNWYASSWYNGPWGIVQPYYVPLFILRIPVSYYRQPPMFFRGWQSNAPPRWGQHWGRDWEQRRSGWDRWNRGSAPAPAPLPVYQRQYSGDRYPRQVEQQQQLRTQQYRYQPRETAVRQHFQELERKAPAPVQRGKQEAPPVRSPNKVDQRQQQREQQQKQQVDQRQQQQQKQQEQPVNQRQQQREQQQKQQVDQRQQKQREQQQKQQQKQQPKVKEQERPQDMGESQEPNRGQGQGQNKDEERGRGRDK